MKEKKEYQIRIPGRLVPVSKEVYLAYYRMARREQFVFEKDRRAGVAYYSDLDTDEILGEETIPDLYALDVETAAVAQTLREKLRLCLKQLPKEEFDLIWALFFEEKSERQLSKETGIAPMTIHNKKARILVKLKKLLES